MTLTQRGILVGSVAATPLILEPVFRHDYVVWRSLDRAPKTGPVEHVQLLMEDGRIVPDAHWAYGDGDGMMPAFGPGWFYPVRRADGSVECYHAVAGNVRAWAPRNI